MIIKRHWMVLLLMVVPCAATAQEPLVDTTLPLPEVLVLQDAELFRPASFDPGMAPVLEPELGRLAPGAASRFYRGHLIPRMARYLDQLAPQNLADGLGTIQNVEQQVLHDELTDKTRNRAMRSFSRALRGYVLETPLLDRFNRRIELGRDRVRDAASTGEESRWGLTAGVSHGRPELGIDYERGRAQVRLSVDTYGSTALSLRHDRYELLRVVAEYDARDQAYDFSCRLRF